MTKILMRFFSIYLLHFSRISHITLVSFMVQALVHSFLLLILRSIIVVCANTREQDIVYGIFVQMYESAR